MRLTNYFIKKQICRLAKEHAGREHQFRSFDQIRKVVVFFHVKDQEEADKCMTKLRKMGKSVTGCMYIPETSKEETKVSYIPVSAKKSLNILSIPDYTTTDLIKNQEADILIDLTGPKCYTMKYLLLLHPSHFKAGIKWDEESYYDFSIAVTEEKEITYFFEQILFYLQTIQSK